MYSAFPDPAVTSIRPIPIRFLIFTILAVLVVAGPAWVWWAARAGWVAAPALSVPRPPAARAAAATAAPVRAMRVRAVRWREPRGGRCVLPIKVITPYRGQDFLPGRAAPVRNGPLLHTGRSERGFTSSGDGLVAVRPLGCRGADQPENHR